MCRYFQTPVKSAVVKNRPAAVSAILDSRTTYQARTRRRYFTE
jgi:hypothetical protein